MDTTERNDNVPTYIRETAEVGEADTLEAELVECGFPARLAAYFAAVHELHDTE